MAKAYPLGLVCSCCALVTANGDDSGCRYSCGDEHADALAQYGAEPGENVVIGESVGVQMIRCVGCGDETMCDAWEAWLLQD